MRIKNEKAVHKSTEIDNLLVKNENPINKIMTDIVNIIGETFLTYENYWIKIIAYRSIYDCDIEFIDNGVILNNIKYSNILNGQIKNPFHKSVYSVGFIGIGKYKSSVNNKPTKCYSLWNVMLERCYSPLYTLKNQFSRDFEVHKDWHNFQNFGKWFEENFDDKIMSDWNLCKNVLVKNNKIYSPHTCCFVPKEISNLFHKSDKIRGDNPIGVSYHESTKKYRAYCSIHGIQKYIGLYNNPVSAFNAHKKVKEAEIKRIANKWKDKIDARIYEALINYQVEITD